MLSPLSRAAFKMDDATGLFEFHSSDPTEQADHKQTADEKIHVTRPMSHLDPARPLCMDPLSIDQPEKPQTQGLLPLNVEGISTGLEVR